MDQWVQKLSLMMVLITGICTLYAMRKGATCWCPAQFSPNHVSYAEAYCSGNYSLRWEVLKENEPDTDARPTPMPGPLLSSDSALLKIIMGELILVGALYSLIKCIISSSKFDSIFNDELHKSFSKAPIYILVQIAGCVLWLIFGILIYLSYSPEALQESKKVFLCDFQIRQMGNVRRHTVQCIDGGTHGLQSTISMNIGLCVVITFSKLVHLIATFGIQPLLKVNKVADKMLRLNLIKEKSEIGAGFGLSDLYFAILVSGRDITQQMRPKMNADKRLPPYNSSRPSSVAF